MQGTDTCNSKWRREKWNYKEAEESHEERNHQTEERAEVQADLRSYETVDSDVLSFWVHFLQRLSLARNGFGYTAKKSQNKQTKRSMPLITPEFSV